MELAEGMDSRSPLAALSSSQQNAGNADVDFSKLTPSQFGISTQSFLHSPKLKDKSRVAQLKARRRSTIGVRGSPETNSLICFRAKQAAKTPPRTPQLLQQSPFVSRCDSLKKKMAAFQSLMEEDEEEEEGMDKQKKTEEDEIVESTLAEDSEKDMYLQSAIVAGMQNNFLSCVETWHQGKENEFITLGPSPSVMAPPSKKCCRAPPEDWENKITQTPLPCPTVSTQQEQEMQCSSLESINQTSTPALGSESKNELLSLPMLSKPEMKPKDASETSTSVRKKRVRFGAPLSPEFFDKTLPPSTPLQKGGTPMCPPSSTGRKRSLLKTPQGSGSRLPQPDFSSPQCNGASPVLVIDRQNAGLVYADDVFEEIDKISFPNMDEESPSIGPSENCIDTVSAEDHRQPRAEDTDVMNAAFQVGEDVSSDSQMEEKPPSASGDQPLPLSTVEAESAASSEQQLSFSGRAPVRSRSRKRKQPEESELEKRKSSRTAAASATGKMKKTSGVKRRFGSKEVDRSLYGKRDFASKNPLLSPIFELTSASFNSTPTQTLSGKRTGGEKNGVRTPSIPHSKPVRPMENQWNGTTMSEATLANEEEQTSGSVLTDSTVNQSDMGVTHLEHSANTQGSAGREGPEIKTLKAKRESGRPACQRRSTGTTKRKKLSSLAIGSTVELEGVTGKQVTESQQSIEAAGLGPMNQNSSDGPAENKESEALESCETQTTVPNRDPLTTEWSGRKTPGFQRRGRAQKMLTTPCVMIDVLEETDDCVQSERILDQTELSDCNVRPTEPVLASWQQADFNIDDILKPVAKSRGSVRRSLRNRKSIDLQAVGLAWVDHTSPELGKVSRRRTRGRLSGVSEPPVTLDSEETAPNLGE